MPPHDVIRPHWVNTLRFEALTETFQMTFSGASADSMLIEKVHVFTESFLGLLFCNQWFRITVESEIDEISWNLTFQSFSDRIINEISYTYSRLWCECMVSYWQRFESWECQTYICGNSLLDGTRSYGTGEKGLTHWGWDKMDTISQTTFSNAFSWMKMYEFGLKFHWSLFLGVQLTISHH